MEVWIHFFWNQHQIGQVKHVVQMLFENLLMFSHGIIDFKEIVNNLSPYSFFLIDIWALHFRLVIEGKQNPKFGIGLQNLITKAFFQHFGLKSSHDAFLGKYLGSFNLIKIEYFFSIEQELKLFAPLFGIDHQFSLRRHRFIIESSLCFDELSENNGKLIFESQLRDLLQAHGLLVRRLVTFGHFRHERRDTLSHWSGRIFLILIVRVDSNS